MAFKETLNLVKQSIGNLMTKEDITDNELENLTKLNSQVEELGQQHQQLVESHNAMKDKYIATLTKTGTSEKPKEDGEAPKTLEEIAQAVISKK